MGTRHLYFAYGSNMDASQMGARCRGARPAGIARLDGFRFRINRAGVATVVPELGGAVFGRLWAVDDADLNALDGFEGTNQLIYRRSRCTVDSGGAWLEAFIYVAADSEPGRPRPRYLPGVLGAAISLGFPDGYLRELASWE